MTHQATAKRLSLFSCLVSLVGGILFSARFHFVTDVRTDGRTTCVKIMTTYSAVAWRVNKSIVLKVSHKAPSFAL